MDFDDLQECTFQQMQQRAEERREQIAVATRQLAVVYLENDHCDGDLISETVPYDKEKWQFFRDECVKYLEGQHCDYLEVGKIFIELASDYSLSLAKTDVLDKM